MVVTVIPLTHSMTVNIEHRYARMTRNALRRCTHDRSLAIYIYLQAKRRTQQTVTINFIFVMCSTTVHLSCGAVLAVSLSACAGLQVSKRHYETHRLSSVVTACRVSAADERGGGETGGGWRDCGIEREINCFGIYYTQCDGI